MDKTTVRKKIKRPPFEGLYPYLAFIFLGFCVADLAMIPLREYMLPSQVPPVRQMRRQAEDFTSRGSFSPITSRNIFSKDGTIPAALAAKAKGEDDQKKDAAPVLSSLPLELVGTIVHSNPAKSVANINVKSKNLIIAIRPGKDIEGIANITAIERGKVIFRNLNNQRLEYIELKTLSKVGFSAAKPVSTAATGKEDVKQVAPNHFEIKRSDVLKYTADMGSVLQQAAMQPVKGPNGIEGFKFMSIQPGSIYTQLGFQIGDMITGVNGEPVDSPAKAMEMYNALKNNSNIKINRRRDGRDEVIDYTVK